MVILGHSFRRPALLQEALTHASLSRHARNNQRMEFLGDRVLGLVVARALFELDPPLSEGELALRQGILVSKDTLAHVARAIDLGQYMRLAHGERASGGSYKSSALADCLEAVIAALYLDGGIPAAEQFILHHWRDRLSATQTLRKDPKSALQEWAQGRGHGTPRYEFFGQSGPDHAPSFTMVVYVGTFDPVSGMGETKRLAEQNAAADFLNRMGQGDGSPDAPGGT